MSEHFETFCSKNVFHWQFLIIYIFSMSLNIVACYVTALWGEFMLKNATLSLRVFFLAFFVVVYCCCFSSKYLCYYHFSISFLFCFFCFFLDEVSNLCHRIVTNQKPELVIGNCHWNCT